MRFKSRPFIKTTAGITLLTFLFTQNLTAGIEPSIFLKGRGEMNPHAPPFNILPSLGTVTEQWGSFPSVILLQDAHGHYEAQKNTERLLEFLEEKWGLSALVIEGAGGKLDPRRLHFFKEKKFNRGAWNILAREAEIGGAELFLLKRPGQSKPRLKTSGMEDVALYLANLRAFRKVAGESPKIAAFLETLISEIRSEASQTFSPALFEAFKEWMLFEEGKIDLLHYTNSLKENVKKILNIDLQDPREQLDWPGLVRFFELKKRESSRDLEKAAQERRRLLRWSKAVSIHPRFIRFLEKENPEALRAFGGRRTFWELFYEEARAKGFQFPEYPNLANDEGFQILQEEIQSEELFEELNRLRGNLLENLAQNPAEKSLLQKIYDGLLIRKLLNLKLTRREFEEFKERRIHRSSLVSPYTIQFSSPILPLYRAAYSFYRLALKRDSVFVKKILRNVDPDRRRLTAVVAGGFHTEGITRLLKEKNTGYAVIRPHLAELESEEKYAAALTGKRLPAGFLDSGLRIPNWMMNWEGRLPVQILERRSEIGRSLEAWGMRQGATLRRSEVRAGLDPENFKKFADRFTGREEPAEEEWKKVEEFTTAQISLLLIMLSANIRENPRGERLFGERRERLTEIFDKKIFPNGRSELRTASVPPIPIKEEDILASFDGGVIAENDRLAFPSIGGVTANGAWRLDAPREIYWTRAAGEPWLGIVHRRKSESLRWVHLAEEDPPQFNSDPVFGNYLFSPPTYIALSPVITDQQSLFTFEGEGQGQVEGFILNYTRQNGMPIVGKNSRRITASSFISDSKPFGVVYDPSPRPYRLVLLGETIAWTLYLDEHGKWKENKREISAVQLRRPSPPVFDPAAEWILWTDTVPYQEGLWLFAFRWNPARNAYEEAGKVKLPVAFHPKRLFDQADIYRLAVSENGYYLLSDPFKSQIYILSPRIDHQKLTGVTLRNILDLKAIIPVPPEGRRAIPIAATKRFILFGYPYEYSSVASRADRDRFEKFGGRILALPLAPYQNLPPQPSDYTLDEYLSLQRGRELTLPVTSWVTGYEGTVMTIRVEDHPDGVIKEAEVDIRDAEVRAVLQKDEIPFKKGQWKRVDGREKPSDSGRRVRIEGWDIQVKLQSRWNPEQKKDQAWIELSTGPPPEFLAEKTVQIQNVPLEESYKNGSVWIYGEVLSPEVIGLYLLAQQESGHEPQVLQFLMKKEMGGFTPVGMDWKSLASQWTKINDRYLVNPLRGPDRRLYAIRYGNYEVKKNPYQTEEIEPGLTALPFKPWLEMTELRQGRSELRSVTPIVLTKQDLLAAFDGGKIQGGKWPLGSPRGLYSLQQGGSTWLGIVHQEGVDHRQKLRWAQVRDESGKIDVTSLPAFFTGEDLFNPAAYVAFSPIVSRQGTQDLQQNVFVFSGKTGALARHFLQYDYAPDKKTFLWIRHDRYPAGYSNIFFEAIGMIYDPTPRPYRLVLLSKDARGVYAHSRYVDDTTHRWTLHPQEAAVIGKELESPSEPIYDPANQWIAVLDRDKATRPRRHQVLAFRWNPKEEKYEKAGRAPLPIPAGISVSPFPFLYRMAVDSDGRYWITDAHNALIYVLHPRRNSERNLASLELVNMIDLGQFIPPGKTLISTWQIPITLSEGLVFVGHPYGHYAFDLYQSKVLVFSSRLKKPEAAAAPAEKWGVLERPLSQRLKPNPLTLPQSAWLHGIDEDGTLALRVEDRGKIKEAKVRLPSDPDQKEIPLSRDRWTEVPFASAPSRNPQHLQAGGWDIQARLASRLDRLQFDQTEFVLAARYGEVSKEYRISLEKTDAAGSLWLKAREAGGNKFELFILLQKYGGGESRLARIILESANGEMILTSFDQEGKSQEGLQFFPLNDRYLCDLILAPDGNLYSIRYWDDSEAPTQLYARPVERKAGFARILTLARFEARPLRSEVRMKPEVFKDIQTEIFPHQRYPGFLLFRGIFPTFRLFKPEQPVYAKQPLEAKFEDLKALDKAVRVIHAGLAQLKAWGRKSKKIKESYRRIQQRVSILGIDLPALLFYDRGEEQGEEIGQVMQISFRRQALAFSKKFLEKFDPEDPAGSGIIAFYLFFGDHLIQHYQMLLEWFEREDLNQGIFPPIFEMIYKGIHRELEQAFTFQNLGFLNQIYGSLQRRLEEIRQEDRGLRKAAEVNYAAKESELLQRIGGIHRLFQNWNSLGDGKNLAEQARQIKAKIAALVLPEGGNKSESSSHEQTAIGVLKAMITDLEQIAFYAFTAGNLNRARRLYPEIVRLKKHLQKVDHVGLFPLHVQEEIVDFLFRIGALTEFEEEFNHLFFGMYVPWAHRDYQLRLQGTALQNGEIQIEEGPLSAWLESALPVMLLILQWYRSVITYAPALEGIKEIEKRLAGYLEKILMPRQWQRKFDHDLTLEGSELQKPALRRVSGSSEILGFIWRRTAAADGTIHARAEAFQYLAGGAQRPPVGHFNFSLTRDPEGKLYASAVGIHVDHNFYKSIKGIESALILIGLRLAASSGASFFDFQAISGLALIKPSGEKKPLLKIENISDFLGKKEIRLAKRSELRHLSDSRIEDQEEIGHSALRQQLAGKILSLLNSNPFEGDVILSLDRRKIILQDGRQEIEIDPRSYQRLFDYFAKVSVTTIHLSEELASAWTDDFHSGGQGGLEELAHVFKAALTWPEGGISKLLTKVGPPWTASAFNEPPPGQGARIRIEKMKEPQNPVIESAAFSSVTDERSKAPPRAARPRAIKIGEAAEEAILSYEEDIAVSGFGSPNAFQIGLSRRRIAPSDTPEIEAHGKYKFLISASPDILFHSEAEWKDLVDTGRIYDPAKIHQKQQEQQEKRKRDKGAILYAKIPLRGEALVAQNTAAPRKKDVLYIQLIEADEAANRLTLRISGPRHLIEKISGTPALLYQFEKRSEVRDRIRAGAILAVARGLTGRILRTGIQLDKRLFSRLFTRRIKPQALISKTEEEKLIENDARLFSQKVHVLIPAGPFLRLSRRGREKFLEIFLQGIRRSKRAAPPVLYFAGSGASALQREIYTYPLFRRPLPVGDGIVSPSEFIKVRAGIELAVRDLRTKTAAAALLRPLSGELFLQIPSFLIPSEEIEKLQEPELFLYLQHLILLELLAAEELREKLKTARTQENASRLIGQFLGRLGMDYEIAPSGFVSPSVSSLLSENLTQYIIKHKVTAKSA